MEKWLKRASIDLVCPYMSLPLLRQATIPQSLAAARRVALRCRCYSVAAVAHAQSRQEPESHDATPVAGPSSRQQDVATASDTTSQPALTGLNEDKEEDEASFDAPVEWISYKQQIFNMTLFSKQEIEKGGKLKTY